MYKVPAILKISKKKELAALREFLKVKYNVLAPLHEAGYEAYIVGGAVRDLYVGRMPKDFDVSTSASVDQIKSVLGVTKTHGKITEKFLVVAFRDEDGDTFEVSQMRDDTDMLARKTGTPKAGDIYTDSIRRDFTMNAIYWNPWTDEIKDPCNGIRDIEERVLRTTNDVDYVFGTDHIRIIRGMRFTIDYNLTPAFDLIKYVKTLDFSEPRIDTEIIKMIKKRLI